MKQKFMTIMVVALLLMSFAPVALAAGTTSTASTDQNFKGTDNAARAEHNDAKNQYIAAKRDYNAAKQDWLTARNNWRIEKSEEHTSQAIAAAQMYLGRSADVMTAHLDFLRIQVENNDGIYNQEEILAEIDADLDNLENVIKPEIDAVETRADVIAVKEKMMNQWNDIKVVLKRTTGQILNNKIENSIQSMESLTNRLDEKSLALAEEGHDVTELNAKIADVNENIALAKQKQEQAKEKFNAIQNVGDANTLFNEGHAFVQEAERYLREAHAGLRECVKDIHLIVEINDPKDDNGEIPDVQDTP